MTRTIKQNEYYHGVVIPLVTSGLLDVGYELSKSETHRFLKGKFLKVEIIDESTWSYKTAEGSTKELTTIEFKKFIDEIQRWSIVYLSTYIPDPREEFNK
jgi:hypothetical protein